VGYFDALTSSSFKTKEDGTRLFFPWGTFGRGYSVPSAEEFERLRRGVKAYLMVALPLSITLALVISGTWAGIVLLPFLIVPYVLWARAQCRRLGQTDERRTLGEVYAAQARTHSAITLWVFEIASLALVAAEVFSLAMDPTNWASALASISAFGLFAVAFGWMLRAKRLQT